MAVVVMLLPAAASAKQVTKILVVGANGRSVNIGGGWSLYEQLRPQAGVSVATPSGPYILVYPLMENGLPMEPGRYYTGAQVGCWSWSLDRNACFAIGRLPAAWSRTQTLTSFTSEPTTLASLSHRGVRYTVPSNGSVAVELALLRTRTARRAPRTPCAWRVDAEWQGPAAASRSTPLCLRANGVSSGARLYPMSRAVAAMLHSVG